MAKEVVILANYRTGSTALYEKIHIEHGLIRLGEYYHRANIQKSNYDLRPYLKWNKPGYVIKIMPDQIVEPYFSELIARSTDIYGLYRKNVVEQIASYYIASKTNEWRYDPEGIFNKDLPISIDATYLQQVLDNILELNEKYVKLFRPLCHKEFAYEDIKSSLNVKENQINKKPNNYDQLLEEIARRL